MKRMLVSPWRQHIITINYNYVYDCCLTIFLGLCKSKYKRAKVSEGKGKVSLRPVTAASKHCIPNKTCDMI